MLCLTLSSRPRPARAVSSPTADVDALSEEQTELAPFVQRVSIISLENKGVIKCFNRASNDAEFWIM